MNKRLLDVILERTENLNRLGLFLFYNRLNQHELWRNRNYPIQELSKQALHRQLINLIDQVLADLDEEHNFYQRQSNE